jgi:hypothetical protein
MHCVGRGIHTSHTVSRIGSCPQVMLLPINSLKACPDFKRRYSLCRYFSIRWAGMCFSGFVNHIVCVPWSADGFSGWWFCSGNTNSSGDVNCVLKVVVCFRSRINAYTTHEVPLNLSKMHRRTDRFRFPWDPSRIP